MGSLCVYCGSAAGTSPAIRMAAERIGHELARRNHTLVYGGGRVGLMGILADAVLASGGQAIGVITRELVDKEIAHTGLSELRIVNDMHERKLVMCSLSNGFIALPGGTGTLEEVFEQWTWGQLGIHRKPCGFLNVEGFFDPLMELVGSMHQLGFLSKDHAEMIAFADNPVLLLDEIANYRAPPPKWASATSMNAVQP